MVLYDITDDLYISINIHVKWYGQELKKTCSQILKKWKLSLSNLLKMAVAKEIKLSFLKNIFLGTSL